MKYIHRVSAIELEDRSGWLLFRLPCDHVRKWRRNTDTGSCINDDGVCVEPTGGRAVPVWCADSNCTWAGFVLVVEEAKAEVA